MARLDKWLWAARFYRTRSLANEAIKSGHIRINNQRGKAAETVNIGDQIHINKGQGNEFTIEVLKLSEQRANYTIASQLYQETPESQERRALRQSAKESGLIDVARPKKRPDKKQRRQLIALKK